jgi:hypothetical protein
MNEKIEVGLRKNGRPLRIRRQVPDGIELDERDPIERAVLYQMKGRSEVTRERMRTIGRINGWPPGEFRLRTSVEDGRLVLRGAANEHSLPEGDYELRLQIEEATINHRNRFVTVAHNGTGQLTADVTMDDRNISVTFDEWDPRIGGVIDRSTIDGEAARQWLASDAHRPTRRACLLNVLASLRVRPGVSRPLIDLAHQVYWVGNDRIYAKVDLEFLPRLRALVLDDSKPFYEEGRPAAPVHGRLLATLPEPPEVKIRFRDLLGFRGEGKPSLQTVIAVPPADHPCTYAEFDLDLNNPLQDVVGLIGHLGELLNGKSTNHLDMRKLLARSKAKDYLYYSIQST